ncbi:MAG: ABC transporter substrate-binding protein [Faecousia sp.]
MKQRKWLLMLLILTLLLTGCGGKEASAPSYAPEDSQRLVVYTSHKEEVYRPIIREFEERTGIWVDVVTGGTNELLQRIEEEKSAPVADVMFGGGVESLEFCRDCFTPYICAESGKLLEQFQAEDASWTPFSALPVVLIYNTKLVSPEELTCWEDLYRPEFQGRIAFADPSVSASSFTALLTLSWAMGEDTQQAFPRFAQALDGSQLDSSGAVLTAVADGSCLVGITLEETALKRIAAGDDIALVYPSDGTSCVPDGSALVRGAPHANNAKLFLDFTASYDVQGLLGDSFYRRTVRSDIPQGELLVPLSAIPLVDYDIEWASENRDTVLSDWAFCRKEGQP